MLPPTSPPNIYTSLSLAQAQLVIAREYGFESWARLKAFVEAQTHYQTQAEKANLLVSHAVQNRLAPALFLLNEDPTLSDFNSDFNLATACVTGNVAFLTQYLSTNPATLNLNAKIAPMDWEPLLYVCFSCLLQDTNYQPGLIQMAQILLENGANANAFWPNPEWENNPEPCLYGATGVNNCPALAEILLKAGANPNDGESLYHAMELSSVDCLKLLLEYGADICQPNNALARLLDFEKPEWLELVLVTVTDKTKLPPLLPHALRRGRSAEIFRILIQSGMPLGTRDDNGLSPYQHAIRLGYAAVLENEDIRAALEQASPPLSETDKAIGRVSVGDLEGLQNLSLDVIQALHGEKNPLLVILGERGNDKALEALLTAGADPQVTDTNGTTALQQAAIGAHVAAVEVLLKHGADPTYCDPIHQGHAVGWACAGSLHSSLPQIHFINIIKMLLDANGTLPQNAWGSPEVIEFLIMRGSGEPK